MYISKNEFIDLLKKINIEVKDNKISKNDFQVILSALEPEWFLLDDYEKEGSEQYLNFINNDECNLERVVLPSSYSITNFGNFVAFVYQYSLKGNPRNVHYAYRLFFGTKPVSKNSGFTSLHSAKIECTNEIKKLMGSSFDSNQ